MKILSLALSGALALGALTVSIPASAQPGPDHMQRDGDRHGGDRHQRGHPMKVCSNEWRHHHKVRVCHTEWRR